jgi:hypothetical protein
MVVTAGAGEPGEEGGKLRVISAGIVDGADGA